MLETSIDARLTELRESLSRTAHLLETFRLSLPMGTELQLLQQAYDQDGEPLELLPVIKDAEARAEVAALKDSAYFKGGKAAQHRVLPLDRADPRIAKFARAFVKAMHQHGYPCMCTETYRSPERQNQLYAAGRTQAKAGQSAHNVGKACDIVHGLKAWDMTARQWGLFGIVGKEIARRQNLKVEWGGDWKFYDPAHWQIASWKGEP